MPASRMVPLTTAEGSFHARVLAARLGADGIVTQVRGVPDGLYPVPGAIEVLVAEEDLDVARELLRADAAEGPLEADAGGGTDEWGPLRWARRHRWAVSTFVVGVFCCWSLRGL